MQGNHQPASARESGRLSLFARLGDFERRSLDHDVGEAARQQQISNWDGVVFRLGEHYLTCRIDEVEEIIAFPPFTPIPGSKDWLLGLANVRGNLAPVADLGWFLLDSRTPATSRTRLIITRMQGRLAGLVVDEVFGQRHFHTDDLRDEADWNDTPLSGLVAQQFETSERRWGVLRLDQLQRNQAFINGARED